jgi:hypothetical protein
MQYPEISILVKQAQSQTFKPSSFAVDLDYITIELYQYTNGGDPKNETSQDIVWCADGLKPRSDWNISEETNQICVENIRRKNELARQVRRRNA